MTDSGAENLRERLSRALPVAMKARDRVAVAALRSALAAIANAEAVDASRTPASTGGPGPPDPRTGRPEPAGSGGDPPFAGTVVGVGATEMERRSLTGEQVAEVVRAEIAERETAAAEYERAGQLEQAERLRSEARVLTSHLEQP